MSKYENQTEGPGVEFAAGSKSKTLASVERQCSDNPSADSNTRKDSVLAEVEESESRVLQHSEATKELEEGRLSLSGEKNGEGDGIVIVDWDGPDDPQNPRNWPLTRKWAAMSVVAAYVFISPVSSSMMAPAASVIAAQFGTTSTILQAMFTSIFVLAYALGPLVFGPLSEVYGRSKVVQYGNIIYLVWNTACGGAQNTGEMIAFRFLAGIGGSAPLGIGAAVISDCFGPEDRGKAIALYSVAPLLGPVIGPICGAWIAQRTSWRWVFWSTTIADGLVQVIGFFYLRETYAPILLRKKADALQKAAGEGTSIRYGTKYDSADRTLGKLLKKALTRPFVLFATEPILQVLSTYMAFMYGLNYLVLTTVPSIFEGTYGQVSGVAGLHYIALGIGTMFGVQVGSRIIDRSFKYLKARNNGVSVPEHRVVLMIPGSLLLPLGLLLMGWPAEKHFHWIVVDIGMVILGLSVILNALTIQSYVLDTFTTYTASANAVVVFFRSLCAFGFPLFAPKMYAALGYGKGDTILAAVAIGLGFPSPWVLWRYGGKIRAMSRHAKKPT